MNALLYLIITAFTFYRYLILARVVLSWVGPVPYHPLIHWIYKLTDPILRPFRLAFPIGGMAIDFSPIIAFFVLTLAQSLIIRLLTPLLTFSPPGAL